MAEPARLSVERLEDALIWLQKELRPDKVLYFLLSVGDGDAQVIVDPRLLRPLRPWQGALAARGPSKSASMTRAQTGAPAHGAEPRLGYRLTGRCLRKPQWPGRT
jgi:hypothetical protein